MSSPTRGNRPLRMFSIAVLVMIIVAHFVGQINLLNDWLFWILAAMALNALQASFTGFCPMFKNADGSCAIGCGSASTAKTSCCDPKEKVGKCKEVTAVNKEDEGCCSGGNCAEPAPVKEDPNSCCSGGDCAAPKPENLDAITIKVLGACCTACDNTVKLIQLTADEMNVAVNVIKIDDVVTIAGFGVMTTPGVVINNKVVHSGSMPTKAMVQQWLT